MDQADVVDVEHHSVDEALGAFRSLGDSDTRNLGRVADFFAGRGNLASAQELISEAYVRIADGARQWPVNDTFAVFLAGVIRSLASDKMFLSDTRRVPRIKGGYTVVEQDNLSQVEDATDASSVKDKILVEEMYTQLEHHFAEDDEMMLLVMGIQEGLRGKSLEIAVGVDTKRLAALRTRFLRELKSFIAVRSAEEGQSHG
ncbi:transposase [Mesorhizobium sp. M0586]|uniref:transposase n=1 Tax=unclassified Mesorhizobium TaxID=325217 RepID=UPI00333A202B